MKKTLLFIFAIGLVVIAHSQTSVYHKFPTHDAIWGESWVGLSGCGERQNVIAGDTVIGLYTYHKIKQMGVHYPFTGVFPCPPFGGYYYTQYKGAVRDDTLAKKVYIVPENESVEYLFYDFSMNVGDTMDPNLMYPSYAADAVVTAVDSLLIGSDYRRRMNMSGYMYFIEGIGSTLGLFDFHFPFEYYPELLCFMQDGVNLYPNSTYSCATVGLEDKNKNQDIVIDVSPNPFSLETMIFFDKAYTNVELSISDIQGKSVRQYTFHDCSRIRLNRTGIENGFYIVNIKIDDKFIIKKKVVVTD